MDDDDQVVRLVPEPGLPRLEIDGFGRQRDAPAPRLGAKRSDRRGVAVDRADRPAALGQEERVPSPAACDVERAARAGNQIDVREEPG